jgi:hypothetical protein
MRTQSTTITADVILFLIGMSRYSQGAHAERLTKSSSAATIPIQCDLCWNPLSNERDSDRLPTIEPH